MLNAERIPEYDLRPKTLALVVDDETLICSTLSSVLSDEGFETMTAGTGMEALKLVQQVRPALVFLDIWMPGWDGIETLERIKECSPLTEVIMMSGHANVSNALEAAKRGAFDFIEKPLDIENIILAVNRALEHRERLIEQLEAQGIPTTPPVITDDPASDISDARKTSATTALPTSTSRRGEGAKPLLSHPNAMSDVLRGENVGQRTLKRGVILYGHCLHSGHKSGLVLEPLPPNSGIHFARIGSSRAVPASLDFVESTSFATTIRSRDTVAGTIEHLMAALHAYKITNLLIKCNGEVPIFDGSSAEFCNVIERAEIEEQEGDWFEIAVEKPIRIVARESASHVEEISIEPADKFIVSYELDYPPPVGQQYYEFTLGDGESFKRDIAPARTFGFMRDIEKLQKAGLAAGGRLDNFILIGTDRVINTELRFPEELARHKVLDAIGDLFLLGRPLRGRLRAKMTGHSDNIKMLSAIRDQIAAAG